MNILVTGGAGFIGANFLNMMVPRHPEHRFINLDKLTYAGSLASLRSIENAENYRFVRCDLADADAAKMAVSDALPDRVVHFAAETHVDRSIRDPGSFIQANVVGTFNLLEACRAAWGRDMMGKRFHHISTDEVYGSLGDEGRFTESCRYDPSSPYSASKASSDHLVRAHHRTFGLPVTITNSSNNYGPYQHPEKFIPRMILSGLEGLPLTVYGSGTNVRDWLHVEDHCEAVWRVLEMGRVGETYNVGGNGERTNLAVVSEICHLLSAVTGKPVASYENLVRLVEDRPGHDWRYAIDASKIRTELGWAPRKTFSNGLLATIRWYLDHGWWTASR